MFLIYLVKKIIFVNSKLMEMLFQHYAICIFVRPCVLPGYDLLIEVRPAFDPWWRKILDDGDTDSISFDRFVKQPSTISTMYNPPLHKGHPARFLTSAIAIVVSKHKSQ